MRDAAPQVIRLNEYRPPAFRIASVALDVDIRPGQATVHATLRVTRDASRDRAEPLVLDGDELELVSVAVDGRALPASSYRVADGKLVVSDVPDACSLETVVRFDPWKNTKLEACTRRRTGSSRNARPRASGASRTSSTGRT